MSSTIGRTTIAAMSQAEAEMIADEAYEAPDGFYDGRADDNDLGELLDPGLRGDRYFAAHDEAGELIGFFGFRRDGEEVASGLGLRPDLTRLGPGHDCLEAGLALGRASYAPRRFTLSVATFDARAISVYERAGFVATRSFMQETNGGTQPFSEMERPA